MQMRALRRFTRALCIPSAIAESTSNAAFSRLTPAGCVASENVQLLMYAPPTYYTAPGNHVTLLQIILVNRHGDRGPISRKAGTATFLDEARWELRMPSAKVQAAWDAVSPVHGPAQPYDEGEEPFGQLTEVGAAQCYALGEWLRNSLQLWAPQLLPTEARHISAHATNIRRTQQSAQNILGGLLHDDEALPLTVPITVRALDDERLIPRPSVCPALRRRLDELADAKRDATASPDEAAVLTRVQRALGYAEGALRLDQAREVLVCAHTHGDALPAGLSDADIGALLTINAKQWAVLYNDPTVATLGMGRLLAEVSAHLEAAANGDASAPRIVLLSGHDSTLVPLLGALGVFDDLWPPYAAHLRIELGAIHDSPDGTTESLDEGGGPGAGLPIGTIAARALYQGMPLPLAQAMGETPADPAGWVPLDSLRSLLHARMISSAEDLVEACAAVGSAQEAGADSSLQDTLVGSKRP